MKLRRIFLISVIILSLIVSGAALGGCNKEQPKTPAATTKDESKKVAEQIAVVNEDTGVEFPSGTVNYSDEFIKTLDEEIFTITSATDAEEGLKDGTYAGSLMFPANLSYMILNINYGNPQKIELGYSISEVADKELSDETHKRIINSYQKFNDRLSYAYINALMEEIEQGQNEVAKIFGNDAGILAAAEKFSDGDYDSEYQHPVLPRNTLDYSEHNTDDYRDNGIKYAKDVGDLYSNAYKQAHTEQASVFDTSSSKKKVVDAANDMKEKYDLVKKYSAEVESFSTGEIANFEPTLNTYLDSVDKYVNAVKLYKKAVDDYVTNDVKNYMEVTLEEYIKDLDEETKESIRDAWEPVINKGLALNINEEVPEKGEKIKEKIPSFKPTNKLPTGEEIKTSFDTFNTETDALYTGIDNLVTNLAPENMLNKAMTTGDGKQTYKQMIDDKKDNFNTKASDTTKEFNRIQSDNIGKLTESYEKNNKYMTDTVEALNKKSEKDQETLKNAIGDFIKTAKGNSADTKRRLEDFRNMLSNAKVDGRVSSAVMEFLIQPIQLEEYITN